MQQPPETKKPKRIDCSNRLLENIVGGQIDPMLYFMSDVHSFIDPVILIPRTTDIGWQGIQRGIRARTLL